MIYKEVMAHLFDFNATTYYAWKKQERPIIKLLNKYFTKDQLEEFLQTGTIVKFDLIKDRTKDELEEALKASHNQNILEQINKLKSQLL